MIRKTFLIIAIIALGTLSALGNTPNSLETSAAAETTGGDAAPAAMLQDCVTATIKVNPPQLILTGGALLFEGQHLIKVSWTVPFICSRVKITGYTVDFTLRNHKGEEFTAAPRLGPQATSSTINVPSAKIPQFFGSGVVTRVFVKVTANLALRLTTDPALKVPPVIEFSEAVFQSGAQPAPTPPPASILKLDITDIKINGSNRSNPTTMQVTWTVNKPASTRIDSYNLMLDLSGAGVAGKVIQTPSPTSTSVAVGLLGIPADVRAKLFDPKIPLTATVTLKATIFDGQRKTVEHKESKTFNVIGGGSGVR
jgi:hypothetical protein